MIYQDQLESLKVDSGRYGTTDGEFDPALLTDGLRAEREQGITIDVAYRYFSTSKRKFIIADTPGHEQYTRNMATGASTSDLAVILVDARNGVVKVKGWQEETTYTAVQLAERLKIQGVRWMVFTDISRDGVGAGLNLEATISLADSTGLNVIASGGVNTSSDVLDAQSSGLAGAIVGRALYEGKIDLDQLLDNVRQSKC